MQLAVWAPLASKVAAVVGSEPFAMSRSDAGWWRLERDFGTSQIDYKFRVNDQQAFPDPRSPWQPHGVHGASRTVDHSQFRWSDAGFQARPLSSALIYELHIGTFTPAGTFEAAIERLDHLCELGVTHVELMPVAEFPGRFGWGYDGVYQFAPRHAYGGPEGLKRLVDAAHARGLAVLLDVVYNHLGPCGNYLSQFGPYFTERHHTPWGAALNFDGVYSDDVRRFFCDNALMWLRDYHFDGLRLDAVHAIVDTSAIPFLEQLASEVAELEAHLGRRLVVIAESDLNDPRLVTAREAGGYGLDAQWSDDFHHALHTVITGENQGYYSDFGRLADLAATFEHPYLYVGQHAPHRRRRHGRKAMGLSGHRFLAYAQNHDQIGNRALGQRIAQLVSPARAWIAAGLVFLSPYVPMLFQGEEWGATAPFQFFAEFPDDPELNRAVATGRKKEFEAFGWSPHEIPDPSSIQTFERSKLDWNELTHEPHASMLGWHRELIELRRRYPDLSDGRLERTHTRFDEEQRWLVIERGALTVVANFADQWRTIPMSADRPSQVVLSSLPGATEVSPGEIHLRPDCLVVLG
ncbi:MAG TPA: malto-oligosyltrehalose trehalohydrolase [Planctomycetaceae bacterium]|nr:malto-oligosyltrehalose trehalohydrolase [Planctomycetaceae bacterium]